MLREKTCNIVNIRSRYDAQERVHLWIAINFSCPEEFLLFHRPYLLSILSVSILFVTE